MKMTLEMAIAQTIALGSLILIALVIATGFYLNSYESKTRKHKTRRRAHRANLMSSLKRHSRMMRA
jgi:hypothetical protein